MLVLAPLLGLLPQAVLAAMLIVYSAGLIQPAEFATILKVRRMERPPVERRDETTATANR
jgi:sulfate permease, SulP family